MRKLIIVLMLGISLSLYSQTITIDKAKLEEAIKTEVQKQIDSAVNAAVAVAVKDVETKYILIVADKDKTIAGLQGDIKKMDVDIKELNIKLQNETIKYNNYIKTHGLKRDLIIGSAMMATTLVLDFAVRYWIK